MEQLLAIAIAFFGGFFVVRHFGKQSALKSLQKTKDHLAEVERKKVEEAEVEHEIALEQIREISEHIESVDMGELVELINETFGQKK